MRSRVLVAVVALAVVGALALSGCTAERATPEGPTDAEVDAAVRRLLDTQWAATGLEGVRERPIVEAEFTMGQWSPKMGECVSAMGVQAYGWSTTEGFMLGSDEPATEAQQLAFYECFARYPSVSVFSGDQRDYMYDYYARSLVPCLGLHGYELSVIPSRESFVEGSLDPDVGFAWSPYYSLTRPPMTEKASTELARECPPTIPGVDGWSAEAAP